ncbi:MAG: hypothetical protein WCT37_00440 [Patescibacteria group bacterium]|jgi:hypothetical protein
MSASMKACVLCCSDGRLGPWLFGFLTKNSLLGHSDLLILPGGGISLVHGSWWRRLLCRWLIVSWLRLLQALHSWETLYVFHHEDCGAAGGSAAFDYNIEEEHWHGVKIKFLENFLRRRLPGVSIKISYLPKNNW